MPIPDETPDYYKYTLHDLHDVARRINRARYPERYAVLLRAIETREAEREAEIAARPRKVALPFYKWIFEAGDAPRTTSDIVSWWEARRAFWNAFVVSVFLSSSFSCSSR